MSFTWSNGRQLTTLQKNSSVVNYTYNADGVRIGKSGSKNVTFEVAGNLILSEKSGTQTTYYLYDEKGSPVGLFFGSNTYYYRKNLQGDIIAIVDYAGTKVAEYRYNAWGKLVYLGGSNMSIATNNHLRYRGYYYDEETGFYYVSSRYYDPEIGRFINADGYISTGQGLLGYNMFAYCGNNPTNRTDSNGYFWNEIWQFIQSAVTEIGNAIGTLSPAYAGCGTIAVVDGPLPFGDVVAAAGAALLTVGAIGHGIYKAAQPTSISIPKADTKEKDITGSSRPKKQAYFTVNPNDFAPKGLVIKEYPGTKNGRIIEWRDPISKAKIFEWNEDLKNGPHYHAMMIEWDGNHNAIHYLPGTPVPEPWNSIYFGG